MSLRGFSLNFSHNNNSAPNEEEKVGGCEIEARFKVSRYT